MISQVAVDDRLDEEGIESGDGGRFDRCGKTTEERQKGYRGKKQFPLCLPDSASDFRPAQTLNWGRASASHDEAPHRGHRQHQGAGPYSAQENVLHGDFGDDGVENQRKARREQETERACARHQAQRVFLPELRCHEHGHQQPAEGENRHAGSSGERCEEGAYQAVTMAGPPRNDPKSAWKTRIKRLAVPPSARK